MASWEIVVSKKLSITLLTPVAFFVFGFSILVNDQPTQTEGVNTPGVNVMTMLDVDVATLPDVDIATVPAAGVATLPLKLP